MAKICLNMIVKNEATIIEKGLASMVGVIDYYIICDTGSTDGTADIITEFMNRHGISGEIHQAEFIDFSQARNVALHLAQKSNADFDYILLSDADMELHVVDPDFKDHLHMDCYSVIQKNAWMSYDNRRLIKKNIPSLYRGVTHEYIDFQGTHTRLDEIYFFDYCNGANRVDKFQRDVRLLKQGLQDEPESSRYHFYLAQTYFDMQDYQSAIEWYQKRIELGGWEEEVYYALYRVGMCEIYLNNPEANVLKALLDCYSYRPTRAEPLFELAFYYRQRHKWPQGYLFAHAAIQIPFPKYDSLFISRTVYEYQIADELGVCSYWMGKYEESRALCQKLIELPVVPIQELARIRKNLECAEAKLGLTPQEV